LTNISIDENIEKLKERAAKQDVVLNDETIEALEAAERGEGTVYLEWHKKKILYEILRDL